jgi:hypothetical protein
MEWCWQISESNVFEVCSGPYLFSALYRFFRLTYYRDGNCIKLEKVTLPKEFIERFVALPLDLQCDITNRIWNQGEEYRKVIVKNNIPVLPLSLWFLFSIYGRLKSVTSRVVPPVDGTWQGTKMSRKKYKFVFRNPNHRATPFILDFMQQEPALLYLHPIRFSTICR